MDDKISMNDIEEERKVNTFKESNRVSLSGEKKFEVLLFANPRSGS